MAEVSRSLCLSILSTMVLYVFVQRSARSVFVDVCYPRLPGKPRLRCLLPGGGELWEVLGMKTEDHDDMCLHLTQKQYFLS